MADAPTGMSNCDGTLSERPTTRQAAGDAEAMRQWGRQGARASGFQCAAPFKARTGAQSSFALTGDRLNQVGKARPARSAANTVGVTGQSSDFYYY